MENHEMIKIKTEADILSKWIDSGLLDSTVENKKSALACYLEYAQGFLVNTTYKNNEYVTVVYPVLVKIFNESFLNYISVIEIIDEIRKEYYEIDFNSGQQSDLEAEFVSNYAKKRIDKFSSVSKYLTDVYNAVVIGEQNEATDLNKGLSTLAPSVSHIYDKVKNNKDYFKNEISENNLTNEEKLNINNEVERQLIDSGVIFDDVACSQIDKLIDNISKLIDNKDIFSFLEFNDSFNSDILKYDVELRNKYDLIMSSREIKSKLNIYDKWKPYCNIKNKYFKANSHELVEILIRYYETSDLNILIDKEKCHHIVNLVLNELELSFNPMVFMEKYLTAIKHEHIPNFDIEFMKQFTEFVFPERKIKLF